MCAGMVVNRWAMQADEYVNSNRHNLSWRMTLKRLSRKRSGPDDESALAFVNVGFT